MALLAHWLNALRVRNDRLGWQRLTGGRSFPIWMRSVEVMWLVQSDCFQRGWTTDRPGRMFHYLAWRSTQRDEPNSLRNNFFCYFEEKNSLLKKEKNSLLEGKGWKILKCVQGGNTSAQSNMIYDLVITMCNRVLKSRNYRKKCTQAMSASKSLLILHPLLDRSWKIFWCCSRLQPFPYSSIIISVSP